MKFYALISCVLKNAMLRCVYSSHITHKNTGGHSFMNKKIVLAYSGGLDTSVAIPWLKSEGYDVVAVCLDIGEGKDLEFIKKKALQVGAVESYMIDARDEFAEDYALISLQAHTLYEGKYPLVSALSRPLISKKLVEIAVESGATAVAHGCTGKGNDQVRFEVSI